MTQGVPEAGREVGLMYSFSSQSDDGFSPLDIDLTIYRKHKAWWGCPNFFPKKKQQKKKQSSVPRSQAVDGVRSCLGFASLSTGSVALRGGGQGRQGLGCRAWDHVVGSPGGLVGGAGQGSPLESGVLADKGGALGRGRRGQLSQGWRQR